jgi:hypothetical protein
MKVIQRLIPRREGRIKIKSYDYDYGGGGWRIGLKGRDVVTSRILPRFFFKKGVTRVVTWA